MKPVVALGVVLLFLVSCETSNNDQGDITVADLVGMNGDKAVSMIDHLDVEIELRRAEAPAGATEGTILRMEPEPGTVVDPGSRITLFVAPERELRAGERPFRLLTHCGLSFPLRFQRGYWLPVDAKLRRSVNPPEGFSSHGYYDRGTVRRVGDDTLVYTSSAGVEVEYEPAKVTTEPDCE